MFFFTVDSPMRIAVNQDTHMLYVLTTVSAGELFPWGSVSVIDGSTHQLVATIPAGMDPREISVNPTLNRIYVTRFHPQEITVLDSNTNTVIKTIKLQGYPESILVNSVTNAVYVGGRDFASIQVFFDDSKIVAPLKQFMSGASVDKIQCKAGFQLIEKSIEGYPACVKPETKAKLIERGWAISDQVGEKESILLIKKQYSQLQDFPSDSLPPKIIRVEKSNEGWYVIFETQGSGIPIIEAKCFFVDNLRLVTLIGEYEPKIGDMQTNISFKTCS